MINKYLFSLFIFIFPAAAFSQITKTAAIPYTTGTPTYTPSASGSAWAIDNSTLDLWVYYGGAWNLAGERIQTISGCAAPAYTPGTGQSLFVVNGCDSLYYYRSGAWRHVNKYTAPDGNGIYSGNGTIQSVTTATLQTNGAMLFNYSNNNEGIVLNDFNTSARMNSRTSTSYVEVSNNKVTIGANGPVEIINGGGTSALRIREPNNGAEYTELTTGAQAANISYRLPVTNGTNGQFLQFTTGGNLQWAAASGGGGIDSTGALNTGATGQGVYSHETNNVLHFRRLIQGTGVTLTGADSSITITNAAPDLTVGITGAGINTVTGTYPTFTITGTEVDGSITNEGRLGVGAGVGNAANITTNTSSSSDVIISGGGILSVTETTGTNGGTITLTATEVDGSVSNEGSLTVATGGGNDSQITSNTSGSTAVTIAGGSGVTVTETGSTITIAATGGGGGTVTTSGTPTTDRLAKFTGSTVIGNSLISESGQIATVNATGALIVPVGNNTTQLPSPASNGMVRYDTDNNALEYYNAGATAWEAPLKGSTATGLETGGRVLISDATTGKATSNSALRFDQTLQSLVIAEASTVVPSSSQEKLFLQNGSNNVQLIAEVNGDPATRRGTWSTFRSRGTNASKTLVSANDEIGRFQFGAWDGTDYETSSFIGAIVSGTPANNNIPIDIYFTTGVQLTNRTERMRVTATGNVGIGTNAPENRLQVAGSFGRKTPVTVAASTYTVLDDDTWIIVNNAGTCTITLPTASAWDGREIIIKTITANTVISNASNVSAIIDPPATVGTAILPATDGAWATLVSDGTRWIIMQRGAP